MADTTPTTTVQKVSAEVLGTFVLVFIGCGTVIFSRGNYTAIGLAFGLSVLAGAYAFGRISGAHFNPAVSVGAAMGGRMAWRQVPVYVGSQLVGAIAAGLVLFVIVHGIPDYSISSDNLAQNAYGDQTGSGIHWWAVVLIELVLTAIFVWVILAVTDARNEHPALAPLAIGLTLSMIHFASVGVDGTSVNPARSIGVGIFAGSDAITQLWLFIIVPLVGGAVAGLTYPLVFGQGDEPVPGSGLNFGGTTAQPAVPVPGYGAPDQFQQEWNQQAMLTQQAHEQAWAQEPIIQDGWQWDHAAQEWKPLEQWQPAQPAQTATQQPDPQPYVPEPAPPAPAPEPAAPPTADPAHAADPHPSEQGGGPGGDHYGPTDPQGGDQTQIRPPE